MLYDVLPPLLLFISFGGIIALVSRVVMRIRHGEFSREIQAEVAFGKPISDSSLLQPETGGVSVAKNRLVHMAKSAKAGMSAMKTRRAERKKEKEEQVKTPTVQQPVRKIQMPEVGFQERFLVLAQKGKQGLSSLQKEIANRIPDVKKLREKIPFQVALEDENNTENPKSSPMIRLVRHSEPAKEEENEIRETQKQSEKKSGIMSHMLRRESEQTPLEKAADAMEKKDYETAEDILVTYIMKHSSDTKAYIMLGRTAIGKEAWDEAIEIFQQVIKLDNSIVDAYAELGHAALNIGKFTLAIQSLQHARDMDAKNIRIREELLFIARRMDNKVVEKGVLEELAELKQEV